MNERLPYEEMLEQKWDELSLPDEDMAWADMKRRLEKDDDDGFIPFWLRGCAFWGIAIVTLIAVGWWVIQPQKWYDKKQRRSQQEQTSKRQKENNQPRDQIRSEKSSIHSSSVATNRNSITPNQFNVSVEHQRISKKIIAANNKKIKVARSQTGNQQPDQLQKVSNKESKGIDLPSGKKQIADSLKQPGGSIVSQNQTDQGIKNGPDSSQRNITRAEKAAKLKKDTSQKNHFFFAVGLALHQQLPVAGQKLTPYNSEGRKESIADYIPSLYIRIIRDKKWFLQAEFRYGAPQYNKEFLYQNKADTFSGNITSTSLKKTFYHQLPITFDYFLTEHWSVGGGFTWNKFVSAVSSQDVVHHNSATGVDSFIIKDRIISTKKVDSMGIRISDSNFVKSYFQAVFETQYQWKRFSVGAKYSFGLEPYIKFILPGGIQQEEKNQSLNIFLRYDLWRSKHN